MARYLFVVPPLSGHVNPTVALGAELERRGHEVAWTGYSEQVGPLLAPSARLISIGSGNNHSTAIEVAEWSLGLRGAAALQFLWQDFLLPLAEAMIDGVEAAVAEFAPDVLVVDQQAFAGAVVARRHGLPWATSATTSAELVDPISFLPKVGEWIATGLVDLQIRLGTDPAAATVGDLRFSEHLVIAFTTEALCGAPIVPDSCGPVVMVGPSMVSAGADDVRYRAGDFPMKFLDCDEPKVLISLGTVNVDSGERFFAAALAAMAGSGMRAVMVAPPQLLGPLPPEVLARPRIPQLAVLDRVDAVVTHAGHNTVCESLARALPLVVVPIRDDQPVIAEQVVQAGAGIRLRFARCRAADIVGAIQSVLTEPGYREAAAVIQGSFAAAGGAAVAADHLEALS